MRPFVPAFLSTLLVLPLAAQTKEATETRSATASAEQLRQGAEAAVQSRDWAAAAAGFRKLTELEPQNGKNWHMLGYCLHVDGKLDAALPIHKKAVEFADVAPTAAYNVACVYSLQDDKDQALQWLDKAVQLGFGRVEMLNEDTDLANLRQDPRFAALCEKVKSLAKSAPAMQAFAQTTDRSSARLAYFSRTGSPGQLAIDYGNLQWRDEFEAAIGNAKMAGKPWRLGRDFWTTLDSSIDLQIGGVDVPAGYYYLTAARQEDGSFTLGVHDAAEVKKQRLDPVFSSRLAGGLTVPLQHDTDAEPAAKLQIGIALDAGSKDHGKLTIRFGRHRLQAPVTLRL